MKFTIDVKYITTEGNEKQVTLFLPQAAELANKINNMNYVITDYSNELNYKVHPYEDLDELVNIAYILQYIPEADIWIISALYDETTDIYQAIEIYKSGEYETYKGCHSMAEVAAEIIKTAHLPSEFLNFFDFEAYGRYLYDTYDFIKGECGYIDIFF